MNEELKRALELYEAPFKASQTPAYGWYVRDANNEIVISYSQFKCELIAAALNEFWEKHK